MSESNKMSQKSQIIYEEVMLALQPAEEMDGPENFDYIALLGSIISECSERIITYSDSSM